MTRPLSDQEMAVAHNIGVAVSRGELAAITCEMDGKEVAVIAIVIVGAFNTTIDPVALILDMDMKNKLRLDGEPLTNTDMN